MAKKKIEEKKTCFMCKYFGDATNFVDYKNKPILFKCKLSGLSVMRHWICCEKFKN